VEAREDAGTMNSAAMDAGTMNSGTIDAGTIDAGTIDAGTIDAGTIDAGTIDAGTIDAGTIDAGTVDAGTTNSATMDGGTITAEGILNLLFLNTDLIEYLFQIIIRDFLRPLNFNIPDENVNVGSLIEYLKSREYQIVKTLELQLALISGLESHDK
jgi:hypothetical protein